MIPTDRWERVRAIFLAALELPSDARDAFLSDACSGDASLRSEVRSLIAAHTAAGGFLETPAFRLGDLPQRRAPTLKSGDSLGRFQVTGPLGAGGMGEVYRARDTQLGREVAIKILPPTFAADPLRLARFERESRVLASLKHPNIATIHSVEDLGGLRLLVLELVEGPTLGERLKEGPLPRADALAIARQLVLALEAAHARGVVHRDLKPANVKLSDSGHVTLLDFGLAKAPVVAGASPTIAQTDETTAGTILGTLAYMSPEQARGRAVDQRADIWAFGCVLFELLTGRVAFHGDTPSDTIVAVLEREPAWSALPPDLPDPIHRLLRQCLEKDPSRRLNAIAEAGRGIDEALQQPGGAAGAPARRSGAMRDGRGLAPRVRWPPAGRAFVAVLLAAMVVAGVAAGRSFLAGTDAAIDSLAVLPFDNRSDDPDAEYLGDELAENLIGQMSRVPALRVMARGTTARFKGSADPRAAGLSLGVGAVLAGTVSNRGARLAIVVELIDVRNGTRLWGNTYDRPSTDLPQLQNAIVWGIADGLRLGLPESDKRSLFGPGTSSAEAQELVMRARHLLFADSEEGDLQARTLFERAIVLDSNYVDAHLGIGAIGLRRAASGYEPPAGARQRSSAAFERVLAIDPGNVRARAAMASLLYQRDWNWPAAGREFQSLTADHRLYLGIQSHAPAIYYWALGRPDESAAIMEKALEWDPGNIESRIMLCDFQAEAGWLDDAAGCYRAVAAAAPTDARALFGLAELLRRRADLAGAIDALRGAYEFSGEEVGLRMLDAAPTEEAYRAAELTVARARLAELRDRATKRYVSPLDIARLSVLTGQREAAFAALEQALEERSSMLVLLRVDRAWDSVRDDPRFAAAVRRVGIP